MPPTVWAINMNQYSQGYLYLEMSYRNHHLKRNNVFVFSVWYSQTVTTKRAIPQKMKEFIGAYFYLEPSRSGGMQRWASLLAPQCIQPFWKGIVLGVVDDSCNLLIVGQRNWTTEHFVPRD